MFRRSVIALVVFLLVSAAVGADSSVIFLDVGQGDATLIRTAEGGIALIDGGDERAGRSVVVPSLQNQGVEHIDLIIASHPHADHIGGLIPVLKRFSVGEIWADAQIHTTRTYERFLQLVKQKGIPFYAARRGDRITIPGLELHVVHPQEPLLEGLNNNSVVVLFDLDGVRFLFPGDLESAGEAILIDSALEVAADVLKVGHHGSRTSTSPQFLAAVKPQIGVIFCGQENPYGHPHLQTLAALSEISLYRTDRHGTVTLSLANGHVQVDTHKAATEAWERINLRQASALELQQIPGIGPVLAQRIVEYVQKHQLDSVDQLIVIKGIGPATVEKIKEFVYIGDQGGGN